MSSHPRRTVLIVTERDNFEKDRVLMESLRDSLQDTGYELFFYRSHQESIVRDLASQPWIQRLPKWPRRLAKAACLLVRPNGWGYFLAWHKEESIGQRTAQLKKFIKSFGADVSVFILSRSAGGRISSLVADELSVKKLICLGYPFKHPQKPEEFGRTGHLKSLKTPFLIIQGSSDEYGGREVLGKYPVSEHVRIEFVDTDHDFQMPSQAWDQVIRRIKEFLAS